MKKIVFLSFILLTFNSNSQIKSILFDDYLSLKEFNKIELIDVRTNEEFKISRLENAINIDFYDSLFLKKFEKYNKQDKLLLYCRSGRRSLIGAKILVENGFKNIYDLKGGVISLNDSILNFSTLNN